MRPPEPEKPRRPGLRLAVIAGIVATILIVAASLSPRHVDDWDLANMAPMAVLVVLGIARLAASPQALGTVGKQAVVILALGSALMIGYAYRDDLSGIWGRVVGSVVPGRGIEIAPGMLRFEADAGGQFFIDAKVDGVGIHFLVDTGADGIALSRRDARRLGYDPNDLSYTDTVSTANGTTRAAPVTLRKVEVGTFEPRQVHAVVDEGELNESLLGMSYLRTLGRIEIRGDTLIIESANGGGKD